MDPRELQKTWNHVIDTVHADYQVSEALVEFLRLSRPIRLADAELLVMSPNDLTKRMIEERLRTPVLDVLQQRLSEPGLRLRVLVDASVLEEINRVESEDRVSVTATGTGEARNLASPTGTTSIDIAALERERPGVASVTALDGSGTATISTNGSSGTGNGTSNGSGTGSNGHQPTLDEFPRTQLRERVDEAAHLNPRYTFDSFVIGASNRFAHAAAVAVAEAPAQAYNPLFIYGGSGLGKTHLLHAIGHYSQNLYPHLVTRFVSSEEFTNEFINSIRDDRAQVFQRRYRAVDLLLIDDIQFLSNKVQTQEEFFHTFNALHQANKQVVITSDVAPRALDGFEDRMRSRFEWGLLTDIQPPDLETRIAILRKKADADKLTFDPEVLEYIASNISTNIRELEGALIRVTAFANLSKVSPSLGLAQDALKGMIGEQAHEVTAAKIIRATAEYFDLSEDDLTGPSRSRMLVTARQVAMYLCRELTELSLPKIGAAFGGRDHTTVMHATRKVTQQMQDKRSVYQQVTDLGVRIKQGS